MPVGIRLFELSFVCHAIGKSIQFVLESHMTSFPIPSVAKSNLIFLPAVLSCLLATGVQASTCVIAGRMDAGVWAPQFQSLRLLDESGRLLPVKNKAELARVRQVELTEPTLLSVCDGDQSLTRGDPTPVSKGPVPAAKPGRLAVTGVGFPKLQVGGELVELKVTVSSDQIVMMTR